MTVLDMVREHLEANGFDGLCTDGCGCSKDDLAPCGDYFGHCVPAYAATATDEEAAHMDCETGDPIYTTRKPADAGESEP